MIRRLLFILLFGTMFSLLTQIQLSSAQSICVADEFELRRVEGWVQLPNEVPIDDARVEIRKSRKDVDPVAVTKTDKSGYFAFPLFTKGKFYLRFEYPTLSKIEAQVKVSKSAFEHRLIVEMDGKIGEPCGGGDIFLKTSKGGTADEISSKQPKA